MRKNRKNYLFMLFIGILLLFSGETAKAAESQQAVVSIQKEESQDVIRCTAKLEDGQDITSGKIRITYNDKQLKLKKSEAGEGLQQTLSEINDCVDGNKPEGEIVLAFAASDAIPTAKNLLNMEFEAQEDVKESDKITINLQVVNLDGDQGTVDAMTKNLTFSLDGKTEESKTEQTTTVTGTGTGKSGNASRIGSVKTGDLTNTIPLFISAGLAAVIIVLLILNGIKKIKLSRQ
ncbi:hypothetical protein C6W64_011690 [Blautia sp. SG-772]|nr:hypothetical protein C6W64_011690 [Blautia sp. SG-772]